MKIIEYSIYVFIIALIVQLLFIYLIQKIKYRKVKVFTVEGSYKKNIKIIIKILFAIVISFILAIISFYVMGLYSWAMLVEGYENNKSEISQSVNTLKSYNKNANWIEEKSFSSSESDNNINEWFDSLNINKKEESKMYIKINNKILTATLENNSSVEALIEKLKQSDITIDMHDYSNFEKVGELGFSLPRNDTNITTIAGDIILYQGNQITIYYDTNSWNFTKLGHIDDVSQEELKNILGKDDVTVTLSLEK